MKLWPRSLLGHTLITIALTLLLFAVISTSAAFYFIMLPMTQRYADDFAAVIVSAAHSLQSLPEDMHAELQQQLLHDHGLMVSRQSGDISEASFAESYYPFFSESLARRTGEELPIFESETSPLAWVDIPAHGKIYRLGFDKKRLGTNPPIVLIMAVAFGALLTFLASLFQVRRIVGPLSRLSSAAQKLGRGSDPLPLTEDGPEEIAALARTFNKLSSDLREMSENRTVMIAGISHDLRTPLTRLGIVAEMLEEDPNPQLVSRLRRNLDAMNKLIGQFLQFSRGIENQCPVQVDLWQIIESLATDIKRDGTELRLHRNDPPCVYFADPAALERVLANLLKNAVQYGGREPIDINLNCSAHEVSVEIADRGPGIPADQVQAAFRPFHRLDQGRSKRTGGSGLGLAIAHQLVVKHGWRIELLPRDGGGTVAKLYLPPAQRLCLHQSSSNNIDDGV